MRIAVCDDDPAQLEELTALVREYLAARPALEGRAEAFSGGGELLRAAGGQGGFDLYVLDILMPRPDGIQTGAKLRELGEGGEIIYLTVSNDFAADSYEVGAFFYLLKPVERERLFQVLDRAAEKLSRRRREEVLLPTRAGPRRLRLEDVLYAERVGRVMRCRCTDGAVDSVTLRGSFRAAAAPLLEHPGFCLCGASYVINLRHVVGVEGRAALLDNGESVPLPRAAAARFKQAWSRFWLEEAGRTPEEGA